MAFETEFALINNQIAIIQGMLDLAREICDFATDIKPLEVRIADIKTDMQSLRDVQCDLEVTIIKMARDVREIVAP